MIVIPVLITQTLQLNQARRRIVFATRATAAWPGKHARSVRMASTAILRLTTMQSATRVVMEKSPISLARRQRVGALRANQESLRP